MKSLHSVLLALAIQTIAPIAPLLMSSAQAADPLPAIDARVCTRGSSLNLRLSPDPNATVLAQLPNDTRVWRVAPPVGNWVPIATATARGYVWADYICGPVITEIDVQAGVNGLPHSMPSRAYAAPARCSREDNVRNVRHIGGLEVHDLPSSDAKVIANLNNGAAITIVPTPVGHSDGSMWLPISYPTEGYVMAGRDGVVSNIVYCTRFYD